MPPRTTPRLDEFLPYRLSLASNAVSQVIAQAYEARFALKTPEWRVVWVLAEDGELTQQGLVGRTQMDKVTVSRAARVLERRKLVRRVQNTADGRSLMLSLTAQGKALHQEVAPRAVKLAEGVLKGLKGREIQALLAALRHIESAAAKLLSGGGVDG